VNDDELRELLALAAVGALDQAELAEVDAALVSRPDLQAELDGLREATTTMADAVGERPPPELRARVLDAIASTPQLPAAAPVVPLAPARRRRRSWVGWVAGAAAAAVVLAVAAVVVLPEDGGDDQVADVVDADDAVSIPMPGELPGLTIVHSAGADAAVLLADGVPVPEEDRVYELWAIRDGTPERFDIFRPDADGTLAVYLDGLDPASAEQWAITEEPAGGSDTPTPPILNATA
jgi:anti-sigma-K factor RskA